MRLDSDDFELFALPKRHALDRERIDARWKALQAEVHPDRFASEGPSAQRVAMQWAVRVNEAYGRLKDPLRRAAYLCELHGAAVDAEDNTAMPPEFLMQQLEWREALDAARDAAQPLDAVRTLEREVAAARADLLARIGRSLDIDRAWSAAAQQVRALMFVERFAQDIDARLEALGQ